MWRSVEQLYRVNFLAKKAPAPSKKITLFTKTSSAFTFTFFPLLFKVDILGKTFSFALISALAARKRSLFQHSSSILIIPLIRHLSSFSIILLYHNSLLCLVFFDLFCYFICVLVMLNVFPFS